MIKNGEISFPSTFIYSIFLVTCLFLNFELTCEMCMYCYQFNFKYKLILLNLQFALLTSSLIGLTKFH